MDDPSALRSCTHNSDPRRQVPVPLPGDDSRLSNQLHPRPSDAVIAAAAVTKNRAPAKPTTFADLPAELRAMIWEYALPPTRVFNALVYASKGLKMQLIERSHLRMPLAHVCFESRRLVEKMGYVLAFRDEGEPDDPGVWFHPRRDVVERTIWGPCEFWGWK
ncbi:hypothetical protein F5Y00DRAFT_249266 [Daldinia vernicosa]|uniref:uncharacterized protein n=1 Tax=Daldinia vernicosa TaxID=114800 RepID=UPI0020089AAD|nr:uncharacterized protein F5Y00DRAFT_249266 [Daldinia vernicosa]KAI0844200.1 hypothetical protein F5Y00DRAFT_249266 [Daldinia vernicosa]